MAYFLIGCTHFGHKRIIDLANRPFESVEEMDKTLIRNWNWAVKPGDTVIHLGDFQWPSVVDYASKLNGQITPIRGNHDPKDWGADIFALSYIARKIVFCHYPIEEWDGWYRGAIHLHAHTHSHTFKSAERRGNVCVEAIDYTPIRLEEAVERLVGDDE